MNNTTLSLLFVFVFGTAGLLTAQDFFLPLSTSSPSALESYQKASHLSSNVRMGPARQEIDKALAADPDFFMGYAYAIQVLASDEEKPGMIDKALAIDPKGFTKAEKIMRRYLMDLKKDPEAMPTEMTEALIKAYPDTPEAYEWAYLHAAYTEKDLDAAFKYARQMTTLAPDFAPVHNNLGYFHMQRKEMDQAKASFEKYIALAPDEANAYDSMGEFYLNNGDYDASAKYYGMAAERGMPGAAEKAQEAVAKKTGTSGGQTDASLERNIQHVRTVWDKIINEGKIAEINSGNFASDIVMVGATEDVRGIDNFRDYYQNFVTGFSAVTFTVEDIFGQGDKLVKHWRFRGTHTGDFFGVPATGNEVDLEGVTLMQMRDGKIAREQDFMDNMLFSQQLGLLSNPNNATLVQRIYDAFSDGDIPTVLAALDDKVVWKEAEGNELADGNPYIGPDAVLQGVFARLGAQHEYFKLKDIKVRPMVDNQVLATLRYDAKLKENGMEIDAQAAHLWTIKNGKVIAFQQYVDTRQLAEKAAKK
ncbi:ester cyclase [Neolewinella litorea]|nr:ester cyclase [Neolewinella litorea]